MKGRTETRPSKQCREDSRDSITTTHETMLNGISLLRQNFENGRLRGAARPETGPGTPGKDKGSDLNAARRARGGGLLPTAQAVDAVCVQRWALSFFRKLGRPTGLEPA